MVITSLISAGSRALPATRANRLLILIYHRVQPQIDPLFPREVDAATFDWQMSLLRRHCNPLPLLEAAQLLRAGTLPPRAVSVTFDDGYADNRTVALPILQRHGLSATFFVAPGFLDGGLMWNDVVVEAVRRAPSGALDLSSLGLPVLSITDDASRGKQAQQLLYAIKHLAPERRAEQVASIAERVGAELPRDLMMTSAQVRELADAGMEIGAHTMTHPILRTLTAGAARDEIDRSRAQLETIVGDRVPMFAYPNGRPGDDYTDRDRDLVSELGFDFAVSTRAGSATRASDPFQLPRFTPWDAQPSRWLARLLLTYRQAA